MIIRSDLKIVEKWINLGSRVLDLGCGDGYLLKKLTQTKNIQGVGVDIEHENLVACMENGVNVIQANIEKGLQAFGDNSFDVAILSHTIQAIHKTENTLTEMLRVAKEVIVTLPNFCYYKQRWSLLLGNMPVSKHLPYQWFNTPNVRYCTTEDFHQLCIKMGFTVINCTSINEIGEEVNFMPNLLGNVAIFRISK